MRCVSFYCLPYSSVPALSRVPLSSLPPIPPSQALILQHHRLQIAEYKPADTGLLIIFDGEMFTTGSCSHHNDEGKTYEGIFGERRYVQHCCDHLVRPRQCK